MLAMSLEKCSTAKGLPVAPGCLARCLHRVVWARKGITQGHVQRGAALTAADSFAG